MGIRQTLNEKPALTIGIAAGLVLIVAALILYQLRGGASAPPEDGPQAYFSDDDGKTWFTDQASKVPPFDHDGKEAVAAHLHTMSDGNMAVLFLERYTPEGKRRVQAAATRSRGVGPGETDPRLEAETEVKAPGGQQWIKRTDPRANAITRARR